MGKVTPAHDRLLSEIARREWQFRRRHFVRELGAYVPLRPELPRVCAEVQREKLAFWQDILEELDALDEAQLSEVAREDRFVLRQQVETFVAQQHFREYERPFNAFTTFWGDVAAVIREERFDSEDKYRTALAMMADVPRYFAEMTEVMKDGLARGFSQPARIVPQCLKSLETFVRQSPAETDYYKPFKALPPQMPAATREALREAALDTIREAVLPAHEALLTFMRSTYLPAATDVIAACDLPDGRAYYESRLREFTTLETTPEAVFEAGLAEVELCRSKMTEAMRETGFSGDIAAFVKQLETAPEFYARTPEELLMRASWIARRIEGKLHLFFGVLPRGRYAIEPVPDDIAPNFPAGTGAPGLFLLNTYDLPSRPLYLLPDLTLHEAVPGHCFQTALAAENPDRPDFRAKTYSIAYGNAWALYCEKTLGIEMGVYETPYELFGMWSSLALRAVRMVVDVGIHAKGWSYERALDYLICNTGLHPRAMEAELRRYISWPGQALGYYLGMMTIERARAGAENTLKSDFDIRVFHDRIMGLGPVPMSLVEDSIDAMIAEKLSAKR
ncbi:MAG: DUF885 family protein [Martelella sp.]|uniref:DUF885 domain-containing protein n=1 Tax=Martelella sp. TaxID=1969699 RepID=UPI00324220B3